MNGRPLADITVVDLTRGCLVGERHSVPSPAMSAVNEMLHAMAAAVPEDTAHLPAGVTFPGVVVGGTVHTAANVAKSWIGQLLAERRAEFARLDRQRRGHPARQPFRPPWLDGPSCRGASCRTRLACPP